MNCVPLGLPKSRLVKICSMIEREKIKAKLLDKLKTISEDKDFLLSIINLAWHDDDRKTVISFIDAGEEATYENIILLALTLYEKRGEQTPKCSR